MTEKIPAGLPRDAGAGYTTSTALYLNVMGEHGRVAHIPFHSCPYADPDGTGDEHFETPIVSSSNPLPMRSLSLLASFTLLLPIGTTTTGAASLLGERPRSSP